MSKIPSKEVCYICGEIAKRRERNDEGIWTGKYICLEHYQIKYAFGTYERLSRSKHKVFVSFDRKNFFWIVVDNGRFIKNPTKDDLKNAKIKSYNVMNICDICMEEKERHGIELIDKSILYPGNANKEYIQGIWTKRQICSRHYLKRDYLERFIIGHTKTNTLDPNSNHAKGYSFEEITFRWLGAERLSRKYIKFVLPLDHGSIVKHISVMVGNKLVDLYGKIPQTKGRLFNSIRGCWTISLINERGKDFDILIFYCASEDGRTIERIYIIPKEEIERITGTAITKNPSKDCGRGWYEQYRIIDNEVLLLVNTIYAKVLGNK